MRSLYFIFKNWMYYIYIYYLTFPKIMIYYNCSKGREMRKCLMAISKCSKKNQAKWKNPLSVPRGNGYQSHGATVAKKIAVSLSKGVTKLPQKNT